MPMKHDGRRETFVYALYRLALHLYPRRFRNDYGAAMEQVFRELVREQGTSTWRRVIVDLALSVFREHVECVHTGGHRMRRYTYGLILGVVLCAAILITNVLNPSFAYFGFDESVAWGGSVAVLLTFFVGSGSLVFRDTGRLVSGMQGGAITALVGMGIAMLTFAVVDNLFLDIVSQQPDKIWNFQHSHYGSMRTMINVGVLRGFVLVLPLLTLVGAVCGTIGAIVGRWFRKVSLPSLKETS